MNNPSGHPLSLTLRLTILFLVSALIVWVVAAIMTWIESKAQFDDFFDTYQLLMAHQLAAGNWQGFDPKKEAALVSPLKQLEEQEASDGDAEEDALGFAVFNQKGELIFSDADHGRLFPFKKNQTGFENLSLPNGKTWRLVWIPSPDGHALVAVGQKLSYRHQASFELAIQLLIPWLIGFFILTAVTIWLVRRELAPIKKIARQLTQRAPDNFTGLDTHRLPSEIFPLVSGLNQVFERLEKLLIKERAFISDAAHELRTPLTALQVQAEVALLSSEDPNTLQTALGNITQSVGRIARLLEQLLVLSKVDSAVSHTHQDILCWTEMIHDAILQTETSKHMIVRVQENTPLMPKTGNRILIEIMLRNLLDNARRYSPEKACIDIALDRKTLRITNSDVVLESAHLARLGQRFFRPPGQQADGSGLGLSIVKKITALHGLTLGFENSPTGDFTVTITAN